MNDTTPAPTDKPTANYVYRLLMDMRWELDGLHRKIDEIEQLRYGEDQVRISSSDRKTGLEVKLLLASDIIEAVKASVTANPPMVHIQPHRIGDAANRNSDKRERFWNAYIRQVNNPIPVLNEHADSQLMGIGILKAAYVDWPKQPRQKRNGEGNRQYLQRVTSMKKQWGPPFETVGVHPLSYYPRIGQGNRVVESIEHSWKPKLETYRNFGIRSQSDWLSRSSQLLRKDIADIAPTVATSGQPESYIRSLPTGISTVNRTLVTEYWSPDWYQVYLDRRLVFEEPTPPVQYFLSLGKSSSSRDPDKLGISVAEYFRVNEPVLNRAMSRMAEAIEITVRKRLTVELPEGSTDGVVLGADNNPMTRSFSFSADKVDALPAGAKVQDPFAGIENVFAAMPWIQMLLDMANQRGVNPIFKGMPPGPTGSGYRDNSLYLMAKAQYSYIIEQYQNSLSQWVTWLEYALVNTVKSTIYCGGFELSPSDVDGWPASIEVRIEPSLPQNRIAEGQFMSNMWKEGHVPRRLVLEDGLGYNQPSDIIRERLLEDMQDALIPTLIQDVLSTVNPLPSQQQQAAGAEQPPNPLGGQEGAAGPGGIQQMIQNIRDGGGVDQTDGQSGESLGGMSRAGQSRQPPIQPGSMPATTSGGAPTGANGRSLI